MLEYIYLAVAVILVVGIAIVGVVMYRRDGNAPLEGTTLAEPEGSFAPGYSGQAPSPVLASTSAASDSPVVWRTPATLPAAPESPATPIAAVPGSPASAGNPAARDDLAAQDGQQGVERLLAEWRAESAGSNGGSAPTRAGGIAGAVAAEQSFLPAESAPTASVAPATTPPPTPAVSAPPLSTPFTAGGNGSAAAALLSDPLGVVIVNMADGKGKLTGQELKRLDVFRPESIERAAETVVLPPRLLNDQEILLRLAQIRLYGATLELRAKWAAQMPRASANRSDVPLSAREFKLKMARDIMALPTPDRAEVIGFLLGGLLSANGSAPDLKRAVIDTLEHLHSAALVNVLLDCLDDPDPIIQEYALAAADRLLDG